MSISLPVLYIDGRASQALATLVAKAKKGQVVGNTYWAFGSAKFGKKVPAKLFPNGLNTTFSIGSVDNEGIALNMAPSSKQGDPAVIGTCEIEVNGKKMNAYVSLRRITDSTFNLLARVTNPNEGRVASEEDLFGNVTVEVSA